VSNSTEGSKLLPDMHYDIVARVIPGTIAIVFLLHGFELSKIEVIRFPIYLVLGYVVGLALDAFAHHTIDYVFSKVLKSLRKPTIMDIWSGILKYSDGSDRRLMLKMIAERSLFRSLTLFFLGMLCWQLVLNNFENILIHLLLSVAVMLPLYFFHWITCYNLDSIKSRYSENRNES